MKYRLGGIIVMITGITFAETVHKITVNFSVDEAQVVIAALKEALAARAPRIDAPTADSPSYPVVSNDSVELELIKSALCALTSSVGSETDPGSCFPALITSAEIDAATLSVIAWLKTIMRELRGTCL